MFFLYLLPDHALEFGEHLRKYVSDNHVMSPEPPSAECVNQWRGMQLLYGAKVLPDSLLTVLNGPVGALHHFGTGPGERDVVEALLARELERACMKAEEKPVTTRFWLFGDCVAALFRWVLLGLPPRYILKTGSTNPRARNQNSIAKVCAFLEAPDARLQLCIACLCFRLTTVATSMTAKKNAGMPTTPLLVQLARGDVTRKTLAQLHIILENISQDPALSSDVGLVVERLLVTMGDLVLRFGQYRNFPCRVVLLSRKFHPGGFYAEALNLLTGDPDKLDRGYSLLVRQEA